MDISALIEALELELLQPEVRKSEDRLNELIADDFVEIGTSGKRFNKREVIDKLIEQEKRTFTIKNFNTIEISADTILATYEVQIEILNTSLTIDSFRTSIWKNKDGRWQIVFHQGMEKKY